MYRRSSLKRRKGIVIFRLFLMIKKPVTRQLMMYVLTRKSLVMLKKVIPSKKIVELFIVKNSLMIEKVITASRRGTRFYRKNKSLWSSSLKIIYSPLNLNLGSWYRSINRNC